MSGCESGSVDDWLSQLPEGKKDLVLNEEQRATLMVAARLGFLRVACPAASPIEFSSWIYFFLLLGTTVR